MKRIAVAFTAAALIGAGTTPHVARAAAPSIALRVMPLGDSITWGVGSTSGSGYRADLHHRLTAAGLNVDFVGSRSNGVPGTDTNHEGHPFWTIAQITQQVDGWIATAKPDVVLLHIGTNDLKARATAPGATARLGILINRIRRASPTTHIYVAKLTGSTSPAIQARVAAYNAAIPRIVAVRGPMVHLVDQSAVRGGNLRDSVHPNDGGYAKMSFTWYQAMRTPARK